MEKSNTSTLEEIRKILKSYRDSEFDAGSFMVLFLRRETEKFSLLIQAACSLSDHEWHNTFLWLGNYFNRHSEDAEHKTFVQDMSEKFLLFKEKYTQTLKQYTDTPLISEERLDSLRNLLKEYSLCVT